MVFKIEGEKLLPQKPVKSDHGWGKGAKGDHFYRKSKYPLEKFFLKIRKS